MGSLEVLREGAMTSIQDLGRKGRMYYALPRSGAMDTRASRIGLLLLGRDETEPVIECTMTAPHLRFHASVRIVLTGADFHWTVNDIPMGLNKIIEIKRGDVLKGGGATRGMRGYITIDGALEAAADFGSASTYQNARLGGRDGRYLKKGDVLKWKEDRKFDHANSFILHPGPGYDLLSEASKKNLYEKPFIVGSDSNRMGLRLGGNPLNTSNDGLLDSVPVLPGFLQLPPSGDPILLLNDGQTTGGYPRIGYITEEDLSRVSQVMLGDEIWFCRP